MKKVKKYAAAVMALFVSFVLSAPIYADFDVDDIVKLKDVQNARISPDGANVLYTVSKMDLAGNRYQTSLWMVKSSGGEPEMLVDKSNIIMPTWSPSGDRIAFFSNRDGETGIWTLTMDGRSIQPVTIVGDDIGEISTHAKYSGLDWSPDGSKLVFAAQDKVEPDDPLIWKNWHRTEGFGDIRHRVQIWAIEAEGGKPNQITQGDYHNGQPVWSPDGTQIAFMSNRSGREESILWSINENYDIWLVSSDGGTPKQLTVNDGPDSSPVWSPDGRTIAYMTVPYQGSHSDVVRLSSINVKTGEVIQLTELSTFDYGVNLEAGAWSGPQIYFNSFVGVATHVFSIDASSKNAVPKAIVGGERQVATSVSASTDGKTLAFIVQDPEHPPEVWMSRSDGKRLQQLTFTNKQVNESQLASTEIVHWNSNDGMRIEGMLIRPNGFDPDASYPLLVRPHGGPHSASQMQFNIEYQYFASQGYVVFAPNVRGSVGYGQSFIDADRGQLGGGDYLDLMSGVDYLIRENVADPDSLFIAGSSYGGFMTSWVVGHTDRFKAAMAGAPVVNAQSFFGTTDIPTWVVWEYLGAPWENPDLIRAYSPITYVQNVSTPTLITHGAEDVRVPLSQGQEFYRALSTRGIPTELVVYPGEQHGSWKPKHLIDRMERTVDWFSRYSE